MQSTLSGRIIHMLARAACILVVLLPLFALLAAGQNPSVSPATTYLQQASERYQQTVDVYTDADAAGNHFAYRGEIDSSGGKIQVPAMDEISPTAPCFSGITCITASFDPRQLAWGGWYFMNGVLGPADRQPSANWGTISDAGYDLTGASALQFWARGANGGEQVEYFCFGVGYDQDGHQIAPFPDSSRKISTGVITLSTTWTQYTIPLSGQDMHYVLGGFGWVATASQNQQNPITFYMDDVQYLKSRPTDPRFLLSYETIKSDPYDPAHDFDKVERNAAFSYDNAVAMIALIAAGDLDRARTIADGFLYAQANDRFFNDGRLRNAYQAGDMMLPPGWVPNNKANTVRMPGWYDPGRTTWFEDETHVSSNTGNVAWAMLALLYFYETTGEQKYLQAVDQLGDWVIENTSDTRGSGGFTGGYDGWENGYSGNCPTQDMYVNGQCKRGYKATEHNIDLYAAFSRLDAIEKSEKWARAAQQAKTFVLSMWDNDPMQGLKFWTGTDEAGIIPDMKIVPVDIQAWAIQALGSRAQPYLQALDYVESHHKTTYGYGFKQNGGNDCGDNTWFEGTSQVAVAYLLSGNSAKWQSILDDVHSQELTSGAVPATDGDCVNTGFDLNDGKPWLYFKRAHVGATAWLSLAENQGNPFRASLYEPTFAAAASPMTQTVIAGSSANYNVTVSPIGGFNQAVTLSCNIMGPTGGIPPVCLFSPVSSTLDGVSTASVTLVVTTTGSTMMAGNLRSEPPIGSRNFCPRAVWLAWLALLVGLTSVMLAGRTAMGVWPKTMRGVCIAAVITLTACGGGGNPPAPPPRGTLPGSYTITISAVGGGLTSKTPPVTLVVQ